MRNHPVVTKESTHGANEENVVLVVKELGQFDRDGEVQNGNESF